MTQLSATETHGTSSTHTVMINVPFPRKKNTSLGMPLDTGLHNGPLLHIQNTFLYPSTTPPFSLEPIFPVPTPCIHRTRPHHVAHFSTQKHLPPLFPPSNLYTCPSSIISSTTLAFETSPTQLTFASKFCLSY